MLPLHTLSRAMIRLLPAIRDAFGPTLLAAALLAATSGCQPPNEYIPPPPPTVTVSHPVEREVVDSEEYTGTTKAYELVDIRARVQGFLDEIRFEDGANVKAGDVLYLIDPKPFEAKVDEARAATALATAQLESAKAEEQKAVAEVANAESQYRRGYQASQSGAVSAGELDDLRTTRDSAAARVGVAKATILSAQAGIEAANAALNQAKLDLGYTKVTSPTDGRVGRTLVDVGNLVGSGEATQLTTVVSYDPIYAYFSISETDLLYYMRRQRDDGHENAPSEASEKKRPIFLGLGDEDSYPHEGYLEYADLAVDEGTGTYLVRGTFPNTDHAIPPGAYVRINIPMEKSLAMLIPDEAVGRDQGGAFALVVNSENMVERRPVELGAVHKGMRVIKSGLNVDDQVVVLGLQRARPGAKVNPEMAESQPSASSGSDPAPASSP
jgi:membrane fusion protein (multidrug efflux system)